MVDAMPDFSFRLLTGTDAAAYQQLRLESLQHNGRAFLATYDSEEHLHLSSFANHLTWSYRPPLLGYWGIFIQENDSPKLIGYVQLTKSFLAKQDHIAFLNNLYIGRGFRKQGAASALFTHVLELIRKDGEIERVFLSCAASNTTARAFYLKNGFRRYGVMTKAIKWADHYDDEVQYVKVLKDR